MDKQPRPMPLMTVPFFDDVELLRKIIEEDNHGERDIIRYTRNISELIPIIKDLAEKSPKRGINDPLIRRSKRNIEKKAIQKAIKRKAEEMDSDEPSHAKISRTESRKSPGTPY